MHIIKSMISAFSMYSKIPMPQIEWTEKNRKYSLCFFPLIGVILAFFMLLWYKLRFIFDVNDFFYGVGCTAISFFITGGIHLDGFADVMDAKSSCSTKEKMFKIMSDPHIGAFASINVTIYLLLQTAFFSEIQNMDMLVIISLGFIQSRALSAFAAVTFKNAKKQGALCNFTKPADKKITIIVQSIFLFLTFIIMLKVNLICAILIILSGLIVFINYKIFSYKKFGGITGDLAGYFLQKYEIVILATTVFFYKIMEILI
mgnify:CR=1 FL=1